MFVVIEKLPIVNNGVPPLLASCTPTKSGLKFVFFKAFVSAFNLYVKPSIEDATVLEIEPLNDFYNASGDAIDWSLSLIHI
mgnify:CR=1 FL=1